MKPVQGHRNHRRFSRLHTIVSHGSGRLGKETPPSNFRTAPRAVQTTILLNKEGKCGNRTKHIGVTSDLSLHLYFSRNGKQQALGRGERGLALPFRLLGFYRACAVRG